MKRTDIAILVTAVALVTGLAGFGIGRATAGKAPAAPGFSGAGGQSGFGGGGGGGMRRGGRPIFGTVASLSGNALVITDSAGTAHNVTLTATTTYTSGDGSAAAQSDLTTGTSVAAFGTAAADGSVTATRVIINPSAPGGGVAPPAGSAQAN